MTKVNEEIIELVNQLHDSVYSVYGSIDFVEINDTIQHLEKEIRFLQDAVKSMNDPDVALRFVRKIHIAQGVCVALRGILMDEYLRG